MKQIHVKINEEGKMAITTSTKGHVIPMDLEALTIGQAQEIYRVLAEDADYVEFLSGADEQHWSSALIAYARKATRIMAMLAGVDMSAVEFLRDDEVINIAPPFEFGVLRPLYHFGLYQPREFEGFDFEGVRYNMPLSAADGFGGIMPMADITAEEWAESNDLRIASSSPVEYAHLIIAILCRPEGEKYNERVARERAEKFKQLPCSLAFDVFFCRLLRMSTILALTGQHLHRLNAEAMAEVQGAASGSGSSDCSSQQQIATEASCPASTHESASVE